MNVLAIDTSNQIMGVAVVKNNVLLGEIVTNLTKNHSVRLMPAISQLMKDTSMSPEQLDEIIVAKGPGSFTGVRIGLATAKAMAWSLGIPVKGVSSLETLAYQGSFFNSYVCPFFDARRGMIYTGLYQWNRNKMELVGEEVNMQMNEWLERLANERKQILFLSQDIALHQPLIKEKLGNNAIIPDSIFHSAKPSHLALAGKYKQADKTHSLTPNYLRLVEAEANWLKAQKEVNQNG
ncbi:tRNA (adenosine(37)-N6)-threonylcarbamoyltransferase complex dimerization subunit type 1 TsaB [Virgibacillus phasianinus]|uniref:tRNA (Adenosine(37)-N6)-threonylcarbamoyltransferase complex dimerization subunit type 1 TsaB n=1 Tax=Virgibacillus phasianinus TaxID=2017483 RepID=A0A220TZM9_9BACI|nr:tRNA (adenosine(37)-N6)-threonylcarbamoyltransferase complex dimerization subunit type 1 TsaB [Virgibacillus phasianinus]ASK61239.1 tRNA (adenosine(37)-N6)-threonylcarbamoyltransferase complex dimerization subunit type 1 TsaB [Virgibacillus phasianinus]